MLNVNLSKPRRNPFIVQAKQRIKSSAKARRKHSSRQMGNWYYQKYKVSKGMNPYAGSKLRKKLMFDHRTNTVPRTAVKNKVIDTVLDAE